MSTAAKPTVDKLDEVALRITALSDTNHIKPDQRGCARFPCRAFRGLCARIRKTYFHPNIIISRRSAPVPIYLPSMKLSSPNSCISTSARSFRVPMIEIRGSSSPAMLLQ